MPRPSAMAVQRSNMRFVPVKSVDRQSRLMVHRVRQGYVVARTATLDRIRGLLTELGISLPQKAEIVRREAAHHLEALPGHAHLVIGDLLSEVRHLDERLQQCDTHVRAMARDCIPAQQLMQLMGIGETTSTAIVANGTEFTNGRQFAAWLGLMPGQYSSGGKTRLGASPASPRPAMLTCAACWCSVREPCSMPPRPRPTPSADGLLPWPSDAPTGKPWWPSPPKTPARPGPC